jgi:hypothetical protein
MIRTENILQPGQRLGSDKACHFPTFEQVDAAHGPKGTVEMNSKARQADFEQLATTKTPRHEEKQIVLNERFSPYCEKILTIPPFPLRVGDFACVRSAPADFPDRY